MWLCVSVYYVCADVNRKQFVCSVSVFVAYFWVIFSWNPICRQALLNKKVNFWLQMSYDKHEDLNLLIEELTEQSGAMCVGRSHWALCGVRARRFYRNLLRLELLVPSSWLREFDSYADAYGDLIIIQRIGDFQSLFRSRSYFWWWSSLYYLTLSCECLNIFCMGMAWVPFDCSRLRRLWYRTHKTRSGEKQTFNVSYICIYITVPD